MPLKTLVLILFGLGPLRLFAQSEKNQTSDQFSIEGEVATAVKLNLDNLLTRFGGLVTVDSLVIFTHDMKPKRTIHDLKQIVVARVK